MIQTAINSDKTTLPFIAGLDEDDEPVFEAIEVEIIDTATGDSSSSEETLQARLLKSPLFARNYAAGDKIEIVNVANAEYRLLQRSGNLAIRVFCREDLDSLGQFLIPAIEKLDGSLDLQNERALVFSIHVSIGFSRIEDILNKASSDYPYMVWYYGNVYDPVDGTTPLGWWDDIDGSNE